MVDMNLHIAIYVIYIAIAGCGFWANLYITGNPDGFSTFLFNYVQNSGNKQFFAEIRICRYSNINNRKHANDNNCADP